MTDNKRIPDYLDCGVEFIKRNLKRFVPAFAIYAVLIGLYSFFITERYNLELLTELSDDKTMLIDMIIGTYVGMAASAIAAFVGLIITGMIVYFTYTKLMTGKEPDRKYTVKRGLVYALFSTLWSSIFIAALYILLMIPVTIITFFSFTAVGEVVNDEPFAWYWILLITLAALAVIALILYIYGRISMAAPLMIVKNQQIFKAIKSSWIYTKKRCFRTLVLLASCAILIESAAAVMAAVTSLSVFNYSTAASIVSAIVNGLASCTEFVQPVILIFAIVDREKQTGGLDDETNLNSFLAERGV